MDSSMEEVRRRRSAYHEAGHAVAGYILRKTFSEVSIAREHHSLGHIQFEHGGEGFLFPWTAGDDVPCRARRWVEKETVVSLAGEAAEELLEGERRLGVRLEEFRLYGCSRKDWNKAQHFALELCGEPEEAEAYLGWLYRRAVNHLRKPERWAAVQSLAASLLAEERLNGKKARSIIRAALARARASGTGA